MGSIINVGFLVYFIYQSIVSGREYFGMTSQQDNSDNIKAVKKARNKFILNIAGAVIFFLATLGIDI